MPAHESAPLPQPSDELVRVMADAQQDREALADAALQYVGWNSAAAGSSEAQALGERADEVVAAAIGSEELSEALNRRGAVLEELARTGEISDEVLTQAAAIQLLVRRGTALAARHGVPINKGGHTVTLKPESVAATGESHDPLDDMSEAFKNATSAESGDDDKAKVAIDPAALIAAGVAKATATASKSSRLHASVAGGHHAPVSPHAARRGSGRGGGPGGPGAGVPPGGAHPRGGAGGARAGGAGGGRPGGPGGPGERGRGGRPEREPGPIITNDTLAQSLLGIIGMDGYNRFIDAAHGRNGASLMYREVPGRQPLTAEMVLKAIQNAGVNEHDSAFGIPDLYELPNMPSAEQIFATYTQLAYGVEFAGIDPGTGSIMYQNHNGEPIDALLVHTLHGLANVPQLTQDIQRNIVDTRLAEGLGRTFVVADPQVVMEGEGAHATVRKLGKPHLLVEPIPLDDDPAHPDDGLHLDVKEKGFLTFLAENPAVGPTTQDWYGRENRVLQQTARDYLVLHLDNPKAKKLEKLSVEAGRLIDSLREKLGPAVSAVVLVERGVDPHHVATPVRWHSAITPGTLDRARAEWQTARRQGDPGDAAILRSAQQRAEAFAAFGAGLQHLALVEDGKAFHDSQLNPEQSWRVIHNAFADYEARAEATRPDAETDEQDRISARLAEIPDIIRRRRLAPGTPAYYILMVEHDELTNPARVHELVELAGDRAVLGARPGLNAEARNIWREQRQMMWRRVFPRPPRHRRPPAPPAPGPRP